MASHHGALHDIELNDDRSTKPLPLPPQSARLKRIFREMIVVLFFSIPGAAVTFLRRSVLVIWHLPRPRQQPQPTDKGVTIAAARGDLQNTTSCRRSAAAGADRVIWLVCEECGCGQKRVVAEKNIGDPVRYFYEDGGNKADLEGNTLEWDKTCTTGAGLTLGSTIRKWPLTKDRNAYRSVFG